MESTHNPNAASSQTQSQLVQYGPKVYLDTSLLELVNTNISGILDHVTSAQGFQSPPLKVQLKKEVGPKPAVQAVYRYVQFKDAKTEKGRVSKVISQQLKNEQSSLEMCKVAKRRLVGKDDTILTFSIFCSISEPINPGVWVMPEASRKLAEIEILGSHSIEDLVNMFKCEEDFICTEKFKISKQVLTSKLLEEHQKKQDFVAKEVRPNFVLFLEDSCFIGQPLTKSQNDILEMINKSKAELTLPRTKDFTVKTDLRTQLRELNLRFRMPYVYIHQDNCEHILTINSARLPQQSDLKEAFPRYVKMDKVAFQLRKCYMDRRRRAEWVVSNCPELPINSAFLCGTCVKDIFNDLTRKKNNKRKRSHYEEDEDLGEIRPYFQPCDPFI